ncbi:MAG: superoxide dismutase [Candidatus Omnitrophica bacterium]|nr:superoxide dismutase [Candidatus Omnitrophota bacterium]
MVYQAKDYSKLMGMEGFSKKLLENHFKLYEGYVKNANKCLKRLDQLLNEGETENIEFSEIKRRLSFELNGIKLHEYYFENMVKDGVEIDKRSGFYKKLVEEFGSYEKWRKSFTGVAQMRGVGWAVAIYDPSADLIFNTWVEEHHIGHVVGCFPILVLDLWEHAMLLDYGSDRPSYIDAFFKVIDWSCVAQRFESALLVEESGVLIADFQKS